MPDSILENQIGFLTLMSATATKYRNVTIHVERVRDAEF
jgi:hypothetical protein